ncbi:CBS domain-containing protein [Faecalibaculum rodentium]|uniref:CBS domain-containing protein n=2 Tax=Faecalibaculum rodentium TaxID=1702221 RepID=UPI002632ABDF|nr:CBS domain-containing protein [Faecalibaculum rodentium]
MNQDNESFLNLCQSFESLVRARYDLEDKDSPYYYLAGLEDFDSHRETIHTIRGLRNILVHNNVEIQGQPGFVVQPVLMEQLKDVIARVENPTRAKDIMTTGILWGAMNSTVGELLDLMKTKHVKRIPIRKDGKLAGVFSENAVFRRLVSGKQLKRQETMSQWLEDVRLDHPDGERSEFCHENDPVHILEARFCKPARQRLAILFVKDNKERIQGMVTVYDIARDLPDHGKAVDPERHGGR